MKRSTTNGFLTNALRTLCCIGALTASSAWANVITLQPRATSAVLDNAAVTDASHQFSFATAPDIASTQPEPSLSVSASDTQAQAAPGGAIASAFDDDFVSVPDVQFVSSTAAPSVATTSSATLTAVPEMSALFPIVG